MTAEVSEIMTDLETTIADLRADILALHLVHYADSWTEFSLDERQHACDTLVSNHMSYMVQHFQSIDLNVNKLFRCIRQMNNEGAPDVASDSSSCAVVCPFRTFMPSGFTAS